MECQRYDAKANDACAESLFSCAVPLTPIPTNIWIWLRDAPCGANPGAKKIEIKLSGCQQKRSPCCGRLWSGAVSQAWLTFHSGTSQDHQRAPNSSYYSASTVAWRETGRPLSCGDTETAHYVTAQCGPTVSRWLSAWKTCDVTMRAVLCTGFVNRPPCVTWFA